MFPTPVGMNRNQRFTSGLSVGVPHARGDEPIHSRFGHDAIDGQIQDLDKPFLLHSKAGALIKMKLPHDPAAPASETINCGCVALSHMASWDMSTPGKKPFSEEEIRRNPTKRDMAEAKTVAQALAGLRDTVPANTMSHDKRQTRPHCLERFSGCDYPIRRKKAR